MARSLSSVGSADVVNIGLAVRIEPVDGSAAVTFGDADLADVQGPYRRVKFGGGLGDPGQVRVTISTSPGWIQANVNRIAGAPLFLRVNANSDTFVPYRGRVDDIDLPAGDPNLIVLTARDAFYTGDEKLPLAIDPSSWPNPHPVTIDKELGVPLSFGQQGLRPQYLTAVDCSGRYFLSQGSLQTGVNCINRLGYINSNPSEVDWNAYKTRPGLVRMMTVRSAGLWSVDPSCHEGLAVGINGGFPNERLTEGTPMFFVPVTDVKNASAPADTPDSPYRRTANYNYLFAADCVDGMGFNATPLVDYRAMLPLKYIRLLRYSGAITFQNCFSGNYVEMYFGTRRADNEGSFVSAVGCIGVSGIGAAPQQTLAIDSGSDFDNILVNSFDGYSLVFAVHGTTDLTSDIYRCIGKLEFGTVILDYSAVQPYNTYATVDSRSVLLKTAGGIGASGPLAAQNLLASTLGLPAPISTFSETSVASIAGSIDYDFQLLERVPATRVIESISEISGFYTWAADSGAYKARAYQESATASADWVVSSGDDISGSRVVFNALRISRSLASQYVVDYDYAHYRSRFEARQSAGPSNNTYCQSLESAGNKREIRLDARYLVTSAAAALALRHQTRIHAQTGARYEFRLPPRFMGMELADIIQHEDARVPGGSKLYQVTELQTDWNTGVTVGVADELKSGTGF